jgi:lipopolysaccharide biosynthesis glycosyltransferase
MRSLIATYCNQNKGDFLIDDWLYSIKTHVNLKDIDIMVIDFGLNDEQVSKLKAHGVIINTQTPLAGRMSNFQYKFLTAFLQKNPIYSQVLYCDCGDIIFQEDISHLFTLEPDKFRLVVEPDFNFTLHRIILGLSDVKPGKIRMIRDKIGRSSTVNCGFVLGPAARMASIWQEYVSLCDTTFVHGTDQLVINYIAYREGFHKLSSTFNYVTFLKNERLRVDKEGFFVTNIGRINVVHNAGKYEFARSISGFGYKKGTVKNRARLLMFRYFFKLLSSVGEAFNWT